MVATVKDSCQARQPTTGIVFINHTPKLKCWFSECDERGCMLMDCEIGLTEDGLMKGTEIDEASSLVILDANLSPPDVYARPLLDRVQRRIVSHDHAKSPKILMSLSASVASLPLPSRVEALAVRIALDQKLEFMREGMNSRLAA